VNNFSIRLKLVSGATVALVLAAVLPLFSSTVFAQSSRVVTPQLAASIPSSSAFERHAAAMPEDVEQERRLSPGPIIGIICAIVASSVALGVAFGLRRQIDRIAGPDPEKADND
jgi:hypothetical protein